MLYYYLLTIPVDFVGVDAQARKLTLPGIFTKKIPAYGGKTGGKFLVKQDRVSDPTSSQIDL
jgi:hypothetical protein